MNGYRHRSLNVLDGGHRYWHLPRADDVFENRNVNLLDSLSGHGVVAMNHHFAGHLSDLMHWNFNRNIPVSVVNDINCNVLVDHLLLGDFHNFFPQGQAAGCSEELGPL